MYVRGTLIYRPQLADINIRNINEICEKNPYAITWSNVPDFIHPNEFHAIAKQMSSEDTVHYMHSCNWTTRVYGTDIFDIVESVRMLIYEGGKNSYVIAQQMLGLSPYAVSCFRNYCTVYLSRRFLNHYLTYFFADQDVNVGCNGGIFSSSITKSILAQQSYGSLGVFLPTGGRSECTRRICTE